jgi:uncharacterized membrane protein
MPADWEPHLSRWTEAGLIEAPTADRIRAWEATRIPSAGFRWPTLVALAFGGVLIGAGVLLFVSAHWDALSPGERMALVLSMVAVFHIGGALAAGSFPSLSVTLHTVGTVALGAGIALAGQIFNLSEHWPTAILLWGLGAALAWALLRHWTQATLTAILIPVWLIAEWAVRSSENLTNYTAPVAVGLCSLSFAYLGARRGASDSALRKALAWTGGLALMPSAAFLAFNERVKPPSPQEVGIAWTVALAGPLAIAFLLRGRDARWIALAAAWAVLLSLASQPPHNHEHLLIYLLYAAGSIGLAAWGVAEIRAERINLGFVGFAITITAFYFSDIMDKLGRSASLIGLGLLFLGGGWLLERMRRRLIARIRVEAA